MPVIYLCNLFQRNFISLTGPDPHVFHARKAVALCLRVSHHDLDVIPAPLDPHRLFTIKRLPDLPGDVAEGNPHGFCTWTGPELLFFFARFEVIHDVIGARVRSNFSLQLSGRLFEELKIFTNDLNLNRIPGRATVQY